MNDRYSNLFLNAYINRHAHTEYLKMIEVNTRKYHKIDVYIYQCVDMFTQYYM